MKLGIFLTILGVAIFLDGILRFIMGITQSNLGLIVGGLLTGLGLGSFLFYKGIKRIKNSS